LVYFHNMNSSRQDGCKAFLKVYDQDVLLKIAFTHFDQICLSLTSTFSFLIF